MADAAATTTTTTTGPPPAITTTSIELPEVSWLWRRLVAVAVIVVCLGIVGFIVWRLTDATALKWIALGLIGLSALSLGLYITGATATDLSKIFAALRGGQLASVTLPSAGEAHPTTDATT